MPNENEAEKVIDPSTVNNPEGGEMPSSEGSLTESYNSIAQEEEDRQIRANIAFKERQAKREVEPQITESDMVPEEDKPITRRDLQDILSMQQKASNRDKIQSIAKSMSSSEAEARAIIATFENRTFPPNLSLEEQISEAKAIVTNKITLAKNQELSRALKAKSTVQDYASGTYKDPVASSEPKMTAADANGIKSAGYVWDGQRQVYKKKLGNGKFLVMRNLKESAWVE